MLSYHQPGVPPGGVCIGIGSHGSSLRYRNLPSDQFSIWPSQWEMATTQGFGNPGLLAIVQGSPRLVIQTFSVAVDMLPSLASRSNVGRRYAASLNALTYALRPK